MFDGFIGIPPIIRPNLSSEFMWRGRGHMASTFAIQPESNNPMEALTELRNVTPSFAGLKVIVTEHLPPDFYAIEFPKPSKNRSKRVWKKLAKKFKDIAIPERISALMIKNEMLLVTPRQHRILMNEL